MSIIGDSHFRVGGLVSGIDTEQIVQQYMEIERKPLERLESRKNQINTKLTAWRDLNTRTLALQVRANRLKSESTFTAREAISSNSDVLTVSATAGKNTSSYTLRVMALAQNHQVTTGSLASTGESLGTGTVSITLEGKTTTLNLNEDNNTLEDLRKAINNENMGVNAEIVQAGEKDFRLVLTSSVSGVKGEIEIDAELSGGQELNYSTMQEAQDAHIRLGSGEGSIDVFRSGNNINDVIDGINIRLVSADPDNTVTISLSNRTARAREVIDDFISQYNALVDYFDQQFAYDPDSGQSGTLFSESALMTIKEGLYSSINNPVIGESMFNNLTSLGIGFGAGGKMSVQSETSLNTALENNMDDVIKFFTDKETGLGVRVADYLGGILDPEKGIIYTTEDHYLSEITDLNENIARREEYYRQVESRYYRKFGDLEVAMAKLQSQSQYLNHQIEAMSGSRRSATDFR